MARREIKRKWQFQLQHRQLFTSSSHLISFVFSLSRFWPDDISYSILIFPKNYKPNIKTRSVNYFSVHNTVKFTSEREVGKFLITKATTMKMNKNVSQSSENRFKEISPTNFAFYLAHELRRYICHLFGFPFLIA